MPTNAGPKINTTGNEVFPSFVDGILYFSSDGHLGLGGLDIFASVMDADGEFGEAQNLRSPINSSWDDFNLILRSDNTTGLFVSNRNNAKSSDDIYAVNAFPPFAVSMKVNVLDADSNKKLEGYTISVSDSKNNEMSEQTISDNNDYDIQLPQNAEFTVRITAPEYLPTNEKVSTKGMKTFGSFSKDIKIKRDKVEMAIIEPEPKKRMQIQMNNIYYEFDKFRLTQSSKKELDGYLPYFKEYPDMKVEISSHTDSRGTKAYNRRLSEFRAKAVVDYFISKGVSAKRLIWKGKGEDELVVHNATTEEEHQQNRRTMFRIIDVGINQTPQKQTPVSNATTKENVADLSGSLWLQVYESNSDSEMNQPVVQKAERLTGKKVQIIKTSDGRQRYCIKYNTQK
jgi:outer membrane protein OmpA-like peptidoglycan-associated protein